MGKSPLTVVGLGLCYNKFGSADVNDFGLAILIGAGYEFARHVQVVGYFFTGSTKGPALNTFEWSHSHLSVVVSAVAF